MSGTESRAPGHDGTPVTLRAILKPRDGRPGHVDLVVTLVARTGRSKVVVRSHLGTWSVDTFHLWSADDRSKRLPGSDLATLPWNGKGPDPLAVKPPSHAPLPRSGERLDEGVAEASASHPHLTSPSSGGEEHGRRTRA